MINFSIGWPKNKIKYLLDLQGDLYEAIQLGDQEVFRNLLTGEAYHSLTLPIVESDNLYTITGRSTSSEYNIILYKVTKHKEDHNSFQKEARKISPENFYCIRKERERQISLEEDNPYNIWNPEPTLEIEEDENI